MKVYGTDICIDCRNMKHINESRGLNLELIDITDNTANLREFLALRDTNRAFHDCKAHGGIGIPCFVEGDRVTLDADEAMSWIGQDPIRDDEILEHRDEGALR